MSPILIRGIALVAIFASIFLISQLVLSLTLNRRAKATAVNKRLKMLRSGMDRDTVVSILRRNFPSRLPDDAGPLERAYFRFEQTVRTSGIGQEPQTILLFMAVAFVALFGLFLFLAAASKVQISAGVIELTGGVAAAAGVGIPLMMLGRMAQKRRKKMEEQFPVALDVFTRALRAGHPISAALGLLTEEIEDPLGSEFGLVADEVAYGADLNDALLGLANRWGLEDIRMFVVSLAVQSETGGNLAEILENLTKVIRDRASLFLKVRALSSEGRMSGWMLTALPVLTFISVFLVAPQFYLNVASDPIFIYGYATLIIMYFIGVYIIRRLIDLKV